MSRVLISFIGRGKRKQKLDRGAPQTTFGYESARYQFPSEQQPGVPTAFFGTALLDYLRRSHGQVDRWLIMGTPGSSWATLAAIAGSDIPSELKDFSNNIDRWTRDNTISNQQLEEWQAGLQSYLDPTLGIFRMTGSADTRESQEAMWSTLIETIQPNDKVTLDITHAFRHMPVLVSFMLSAIRWIHHPITVDLYYGALEMVDEGETVEVLHLPLVSELMDIAEASATYNHTGNYQPALNVLGFKGDHEAEAVVYADELNQPAEDKAGDLLHRVDKKEVQIVAASLKVIAMTSLNWVAREGIARQMANKASRACKSGQYSNAIALLYEAIRVALSEDIVTTATTEHDKRKEGWKQFKASPLATEKQISLLAEIENLRNAVQHGLLGKSLVVKRALIDSSRFIDIMKEGLEFLDDYLTSKGK